MESRILRTLVTIGVPGVALGVFYLLLRGFGFKFSEITPTWAAIIAVIFLLIVGGITFYALYRWAPQQGGRKVMDSAHRPAAKNIRQAMSFQLSWIVMSLISGNARHPEAVKAQITSHSQDLELKLPEKWTDLLRTDDQGKSIMDLVELLGGQLVARQPELAPYFEAGFNLVLDAGREEGKGIKRIIEKLDLPKELRKGRKNAIEWINAIHDHYEKVLRSAIS
jgi:hypothetical protein